MITIIIITVVAGALLGFTTSARTPSDGLEDLIRNVLVGMAGAFVGLQVAGRMLSSATEGPSAIALGIAGVTGASVILFIVNRVRRA